MRGLATAFAGLVMAVALGACGGKVSPVTDADMSLGDAKAKVTVIEYASVSCPVCAEWNNANWDTFKKRYIDTNRVHYVLREALTHDPVIATSGFMIARCAGKAKYFDVVEAMYKNRDAIEASSAPRDNLLAIAKSAGLSDEQFTQCLNDDKTAALIRQRWEGYGTKDKIDATPTFDVNGKRIVGNASLEELDKAISEAEQAK